MTQSFCKIRPDKVNVNGVLEEPMLFNDLMRLTNNNQQLSIALYSAATSPEFLDIYSGRLDFDSQDNPTISSLLKIKEIRHIYDMNTDSPLRSLNEAYQSGVYSFDEAIQRAEGFNRLHLLDDDYFGTISEVTEGPDSGKWRFSIVESSTQEKEAVRKTILQKSFRDQLIYLLAHAGVKTEFVDQLLEQEAGVQGIYNTVAPEKVFDSLYNVIKILNKHGDENLSEQEKLAILKEETGHLIVGIAENNNRSKALISRLISAIKNAPDPVLEEIFTTYGHYPRDAKGNLTTDAKQEVADLMSSIVSSESRAREAAGRIVALMLNDVDATLKPKKDYHVLRNSARIASAIGLGAAIVTGAPLAVTAGSILTGIVSLSRTLRNALKHIFNLDLKGAKYRDSLNKEDIIYNARQLASKFMNDDLGDIYNALMTKEVQHHQSLIEGRVTNRLATAYKAYVRTLENIGLTNKEKHGYFSTLNSALQAGKAFRQLGKKQSSKGNQALADSYFSKSYIATLGQMLLDIKGLLQDTQLNLLNPILDSNFSEKLQSGELALIPNLNAKVDALTHLIALLRLVRDADLIMQDLFSDTNSVDKEALQTYNIDTLRSSLAEISRPILDSVERINSSFQEASFLTINGGQHYITASRRFVALKKSKPEADQSQKITGKVNRSKVIISDEFVPGKVLEGGRRTDRLTIHEVLDGDMFTDDASVWGVWCQRMNASIDIVNQMVSALYDYNKAETSKTMYRYSQLLLEWHERVKKDLGDEDTTFVCEMNEDGTITGNIVQPDFNYGKWEKDFEEAVTAEKRRIRKELQEEIEKGDLELNEFELGEKVYEQLSPFIKQWHKENSQPVPKGYVNELFKESPFDDLGPYTRYLPGAKYASKQWDNLSDKQKELIKDYIKIKQSLDEYVEEYHPHSITSHRLPQFRGTFISNTKHKSTYEVPEGPRNRRQRLHDWGMQKVNVYRNIHDKFIAAFYADALDEDFGDNSTFNNEDDYFFDHADLSDNEMLRRIPVYGVNKLKDMHNLSTDVVFSTMHYAAMAINVKGLTVTANILRNGSILWDKRQVKGTLERGKPYPSNKKLRYQKFLEMQVFNIRGNRLDLYTNKNGRTLVANKIVGWLNRTGAWWLLAGKLASGTVNTGTGILQCLSEAAIGEHFNKATLAKAFAEYVKYATEANVNEGLAPLNRSNKMYSFIRYFDALNDNDSYFRDFTSHIQLGRISQLRKLNYAMWVYSSGNHLMQTLPYIAKAMHTKLYTLKEGVDPTTADMSDPNNFVEAESVWDTFDEAHLQRGKKAHEYATEKARRGEKEVVATPTLPNIPTEEGSGVSKEADLWGNPFQGNYYIRNKDGSFSAFDRLGQSQFQTQCRIITDNMHGIYNNPDAVALQQGILGASTLTMRKYLFGYIDKFWLTDRYNFAEKRHTEGAVVTWLKMMHYYAFGERNKKITGQLFAMGAPVVTSAFLLTQGSSIASGIAALSYCAVSKLLLKNIKGDLKNRLKLDDYVVYNIQRFDTHMRLNLTLRLLSFLLAKSLWTGLVGHDDDDDGEEEVELNFGSELDAWILKLLGYDQYEEAVLNAATSQGKVDKNKKVGGALYNIIKYEIEKAKRDGNKDKAKNLETLQYWAGVSYYFLHRWHLEEQTMFTADLSFPSWKEFTIQMGQNANFLPTGVSFFFNVADKIATIFQHLGVTYKYDKKAESFGDILKNYKDWDEHGIPAIIKALRTGQHLVFGDNRGVNDIISLAPYLNSLRPFEDMYKGAESYDMGRKMSK